MREIEYITRTNEVIYETTRPVGVYQKPYFRGNELGSNVADRLNIIDASINILKGLFGK